MIPEGLVALQPLTAAVWLVAGFKTFPLGVILAYLTSRQFEVSGLVLFGAGSFIYIAASDLVPELKSHGNLGRALLHFGCFVSGLALTLLLAYAEFPGA